MFIYGIGCTLSGPMQLVVVVNWYYIIGKPGLQMVSWHEEQWQLQPHACAIWCSCHACAHRHAGRLDILLNSSSALIYPCWMSFHRMQN